MVRESKDIECNARSKAIRGISEYILDLRKDMERYQDEVGLVGAAFVSTNSKV